MIGVVLWLGGCNFTAESKPSILVVTVEGLGLDSFNCESDQLAERDMAGFKAFCEESIRFSHAFAPSSMSQPTLSSLLTGQNPIDHGVHHNGSQFLTASIETLPEVAVRNGFRTLFVSGGPPIWRKSGLVQGFEIFDDYVDVAPGRYYRPVGEVFQVFQSWLTREVESSPFLSVLYLPDLQFSVFATKATDGETRERSIRGQIAQVGESLGQLVTFLKANRRWNSTNIILVGLNAMTDENFSDEPSLMRLKSKDLQVALYVKPSRRERDGALQWTIDKSVSLVDLGWTLMKMVGGEPKPSRFPALQPVSLAMAFNSPTAGWSENRILLSESGWSQWLAGAGIRYAIRQNQFLYIHDTRSQIYNTLTDRLETVRLSATDPLWSSLSQDVQVFLDEARLTPFAPVSPGLSQQIEMAKSIWSLLPQPSTWDLLWQQVERNPGSAIWLGWAARVALKEGRWKDLAILGERASEALWVFVARSNLGERVSPPGGPCLSTFFTGLSARPLDCDEPAVIALYDWMKADSDESRSLMRDKFMRVYLQDWMNDQVGILNYQNDLRWDVKRSIPRGPSTVEMLLALKDFESFRQKVQTSLAGIDRRL